MPVSILLSKSPPVRLPVPKSAVAVRSFIKSLLPVPIASCVYIVRLLDVGATRWRCLPVNGRKDPMPSAEKCALPCISSKIVGFFVDFQNQFSHVLSFSLFAKNQFDIFDNMIFGFRRQFAIIRY